ncbi:ankyrin repeat domain-containing protein, partial [Brachyspira pilosicoli]
MDNNNNNNNNNNQYDENKKYLFKVIIIALAIIFILLIGAGILVGTFLFITQRSNLNKMTQNYEIYDEAIYNKKYGDRVVKEFVNNYGADVNETDIENRTPLYHAVEANNIKAVKFLIENKADTEISSDEGITPLILAIKNNNKKIAELLIKEGNANVYGSYTGDDIKNYPMYYAISQTNKNMIKLLLDNSFDLKREPTILSYAIENSDRSIVKYLVDNGADINYKNADGSTVLYNSVVSLNYDLFKYFLDKGSKLENTAFNNKYGNIIMAAAGSKFNNSSSKQPVDLVLLQNGSQNSAKIMNDIITNFDKNDINSYINGMNALIIASGNSYIDTVRILLENGADVNSYDNDGWTSLMYAANNGDIELAKLLISNNANVNIQSYDYSTALMCAIKSPIVKTRMPMIELIIANKDDIN